MTSNFTTISEVVRENLCSGCGACAYAVPDKIRMVDVPSEGRRPRTEDACISNEEHRRALSMCPGIHLAHTFDHRHPHLVPELIKGWGPVFELWEGYAADPELRFAGSSGGAASALAAFALEKAEFDGVIHTGSNPDAPHLNQTVVSRNRTELLSRTGSRYSPASPCDGLAAALDAGCPSLFIGKPCDVAATKKAMSIDQALSERIGITIAFFCAGTPSTNGTLQMLEDMGVTDASTVFSLRYRGNGWPGLAQAKTVSIDGSMGSHTLTYDQAWGDILTKYVQWRCKICPDHTGEFADIAVGDPWYREIQPGEAGTSLIVVRTERGRRFLHEALREGYVVATESRPNLLPKSQPNLLKTRGAVWGRLLGARIAGAKTPAYSRMIIFRFWCKQLGIREKIRSVGGALLRVKRLRRQSRSSSD